MSSDSDPLAEPLIQEPVTLSTPVAGGTARLHLHNRPETISNFIRRYGVWQRPATMFIITYLEEGDVFVDVGANIGYFSVQAGLCVGSSGRVHAIEPDADNAAVLQANASLNNLTNLRLHQTAIADFEGEATLFRGGYNAGAHSLLQKEDLTAGSKVPVTTLERLMAEESSVKLVKIDVQGAEMAVLRSLDAWLAQRETRPAVMVEFSPIDLNRNGQLDAFFDFVARHSYSLRAFIANDRMTTKPPQLRRATLRQIADDLIYAGDAAEFDILLLPHE